MGAFNRKMMCSEVEMTHSSPVKELVEYLDFVQLSSKVAVSFDFT